MFHGNLAYRGERNLHGGCAFHEFLRENSFEFIRGQIQY